MQLIEWLTQSLDKPDEKIEQMWAKEAEKRYEALKEGKAKTIPRCIYKNKCDCTSNVSIFKTGRPISEVLQIIEGIAHPSVGRPAC